MKKEIALTDILDEIISNEEGFYSQLYRDSAGKYRVSVESDGKTYDRYLNKSDREIHYRFFEKAFEKA